MDLEQAHAVLETAHSAFISADEQGRITYWNRRAEEIFKIPRENALGRTVAETIIPSRYREQHEQGLRRFLAQGASATLGRRLELTAIDADGGELPIEIAIAGLEDAGKWSFHAFIADISERRRAEQERQRLLDRLEGALAGTEHRFEVILGTLAEAVTIREPEDNRLIYANEAALELMGLDSMESVRAADPGQLLAPYELSDEHGNPIAIGDLPSVRLLAGEQPPPLLMRSIHKETGQERWVLLKSAVVHDLDGYSEAAVTIIEDVTTETRAAMRMRFLASASEVLASSLDYQQTIRNVAGLAVPQIADWCGVDLFDESGGREPVAVAHSDPSKLETAKRLRAHAPAALDPNRGAGLVKRTGRAILHARITDEMLSRSAIDEKHLELLRAVGMRSVLIAPMKAGRRTIGALTLVNAESGRTFDEHDVEFAEEIAKRAALAVENARVYTERAAVATTLQRSLLPDVLPTIPGWQTASMYQPAGRGSDVGGDFYDIWDVRDGWIVMIGDVTGKGAPAAALTSLVRYTAIAASEFDTSPSAILAHVDKALRRKRELSLCTALMLHINGAKVQIAAGGHPLPLLYDGQEWREVGEHGTLLGAFEDVRRPTVSIQLQPGASLLAYTDGVTDARGTGGERFGTRRLHDALASVRGHAPEAITTHLASLLNEYETDRRADDTAVVVLRYTAQQASSTSSDCEPAGEQASMTPLPAAREPAL